MKLKNVGLVLAIAALFVSGPRLVLSFLTVDRIAMSIGFEATMMTLTAIAT